MHMVASSNRKMQRVLQFSMALTTAYVLATFYFVSQRPLKDAHVEN